MYYFTLTQDLSGMESKARTGFPLEKVRAASASPQSNGLSSQLQPAKPAFPAELLQRGRRYCSYLPPFSYVKNGTFDLTLYWKVCFTVKAAPCV